MSLSANFPREEILISSPSSSTMATREKIFYEIIISDVFKAIKRATDMLCFVSFSPSNSAWPTPTMMIDMGSLAACNEPEQSLKKVTKKI